MFDTINRPRDAATRSEHAQRVMNLISRHNYRENPIINVRDLDKPGSAHDVDYHESHLHNRHFALVHPKILMDEKAPTSPALRKLTMYDPSTQGLKHFDLTDKDINEIRASRVHDHVEGNTGIPATFTHIPERIKNQVPPIQLSNHGEKHHELFDNYKEFNRYNVKPSATRQRSWASHYPGTWNGDSYKHTNDYLRGFTNHYPKELEKLGTGDLARIYSTSNSTKINGGLVSAHLQEPHVHPAALHEFTKRITDGMAKTPLKNHLTTYSGMTFNPEEQLNKGVYHAPAFTSTSISPRVPKAFIHSKEPHEEKHVGVFHFKPGYNKGAYIYPVSTHPNEYEYLLAPNQKFRHIRSVKGKTLRNPQGTSSVENVTYHHFEPIED